MTQTVARDRYREAVYGPLLDQLPERRRHELAAAALGDGPLFRLYWRQRRQPVRGRTRRMRLRTIQLDPERWRSNLHSPAQAK